MDMPRQERQERHGAGFECVVSWPLVMDVAWMAKTKPWTQRIPERAEMPTVLVPYYSCTSSRLSPFDSAGPREGERQKD
jgi:hypothetical protein